MRMTREEAIAILEESKRQNEIMRDNPSTFWTSHQMADGIKNTKRRIEALDVAITSAQLESGCCSATSGQSRGEPDRAGPGMR